MSERIRERVREALRCMDHGLYRSARVELEAALREADGTADIYGRHLRRVIEHVRSLPECEQRSVVARDIPRDGVAVPKQKDES